MVWQTSFVSQWKLIHNWEADLPGLSEAQLRERLDLASGRAESSLRKGTGRNPKAAREWRVRRRQVEVELERRAVDRDPLHVVSAARSRFVGMEFEHPDGDWVGHDMVVDGDSVIMQFVRVGHDEVLGVRLPVPVLPLEGMSYRGMWMRTTDDWLNDVRVTLMEEIDTGLPVWGDRIPHSDWTEIRLSFDPSTMKPSADPLTDWAE